LADITAEFTLSTGATATVDGTPQVSGTTANDFNDPVTYNVTSGDGETTLDWTVTITKEGGDTNPTDPTNWTVLENTVFGTRGRINSIAYGDGKFVAVGYKAEELSTFFSMAYSTDGINWTAVENTGLTTQYSSFGDAMYNAINDIAYGNGKFVVVTGNNQIAYSTDGINWTASGASGFISTINNDLEYTEIESIVYGDGKFIIGGTTGGTPGYTPDFLVGTQMAYSTDGITWTPINTTEFGFDLDYKLEYGNHSVDELFFGNGIFHAVQNNTDAKAAYSTDGVNWTAMPNLTPIYAMAYGNNKFVASLRDDDEMAYSSDGINWTQVNTNESDFGCMIYANGKFVAIGTGDGGNNDVWTSTDGIAWTHNEVYGDGSHTNSKIAYGGGKLVIVGYNGNVPVIAYCNY
jgi:hypothetical protein